MTIARFILRIPTDLNKWLIQQASKHNRSKNQEIVNILTKVYEQDEYRMGAKGDEKE